MNNFYTLFSKFQYALNMIHDPVHEDITESVFSFGEIET